MPELAEVEYYRKKWDNGLEKRVSSVVCTRNSRIFRNFNASAFKRILAAKILVGSHIHGKQMLFEFNDGIWLGLHLGMTGKLSCRPSDVPIEKHDHLVINLEEIALVFTDPRMFGVVSIEETEGGFPEWWRALPAEILSDEFTPELVSGYLKRHRRSLIKPLLLKQERFPGIGNWMADEILWRMRIDPATLCGELSSTEGRMLWKISREVARDAMRVIGTDWNTPPNSWLFNHRWKDGGHCPRCDCSSPLTRADLRGRTTCWCPVCQSS